MTFKDKMRNELINAGKRADDKGKDFTFMLDVLGMIIFCSLK